MNKEIQRFLDAFPKELENDIRIICENINLSDGRCSDFTFEIKIDKEKVNIPERIYYKEPEEFQIKKLTEFQRSILNCYFTRHDNGYVRQNRLRDILRGHVEKWMIPYLSRLVGEYVEGILTDIYVNIDLINIDDLKDFINNNKDFVKLTECRVLSYWNEYHRHIDKNDYVGFKIIEKINSLMKPYKGFNFDEFWDDDI